MIQHRRTSGWLRRTAGALTAAACVATLTIAGAVPAARAESGARAGGGTGATVEVAATGPARSLGEPAAAIDGAVSAVAATSFGAAGAQVRVWTRRTNKTAWTQAGLVLPAGFGSSYDASAAASPSGRLFVVAGAAPPGESCITNGSVAIASVDSRGRLGAARLVSDQRGTGHFDDRPAVAIGPDGTVWVAWSQGPDSDACQNVGTGDRLEVAASRDGGRTFSAPVAMPAEGGDSAFGARLAPLPGQVAVSWTERTGNDGQGVFVSVLRLGQRPSQPRLVLTGDGPPLDLPGASFFDFPAGDIVALPGGGLMVAAPYWQSGRSVIKIAAGTPGGPWRLGTVTPPAGADLLLPALGALSADEVRLLCAVHTRSGDRLGYDWADIRVTGQGAPAISAGLAPLTPAPPGPGFFEIGEELSMTSAPAGLLTSIVLAGRDGARLETVEFKTPRPVSRPAGTKPARPAPASSEPSSRPAPATATQTPGTARLSGAATAAAWTGAVLLCAALAATILFVTRRARRHRNTPARHRAR